MPRPKGPPNQTKILEQIDRKTLRELPKIHRALLATALEKKDTPTLRFLYEQAVGKAKTKAEGRADYTINVIMSPLIDTVERQEPAEAALEETEPDEASDNDD